MIDPHIAQILREIFTGKKRVTVLTGAGISAESGIPTFRGPEGYWTVGAKEYHPQEMATQAMFERHPADVWQWYLYRRSVCRNADPNPGHLALVEMEKHLGDRFTLITQNVDGLHLRAGNSPAKTYQIHGNIDYMRCSLECSEETYPVPESIPFSPVSREYSRDSIDRLTCPKCGHTARPHVLWFDESYDEAHFKFASSLETAQHTDLLFIIGTSGATTLPNHIAHLVAQNGGLIVDINIERNPFADLAVQNRGFSLQGSSGVLLPQIVAILNRALTP